MTGSWFSVLARVFAALAFVVSGVSRTVMAQTVDADAVYKANCATCHDQPTGRTPSKDALKERTADQILLALTSGSIWVNTSRYTCEGAAMITIWAPASANERARSASPSMTDSSIWLRYGHDSGL